MCVLPTKLTHLCSHHVLWGYATLTKQEQAAAGQSCGVWATGLLVEYSAELNLDTSTGRKRTQVSGCVVRWMQQQNPDGYPGVLSVADLFVLCVSSALFTTWMWTSVEKGTLTNWTVKTPQSWCIMSRKWWFQKSVCKPDCSSLPPASPSYDQQPPFLSPWQQPLDAHWSNQSNQMLPPPALVADDHTWTSHCPEHPRAFNMIHTKCDLDWFHTPRQTSWVPCRCLSAEMLSVMSHFKMFYTSRLP